MLVINIKSNVIDIVNQSFISYSKLLSKRKKYFQKYKFLMMI